MTENERPPGANVIDVLLAVRVPNMRAISPLNKERLAANGPKRTNRRIHSAGDDLLRTIEKLFRLGHDERLKDPGHFHGVIRDQNICACSLDGGKSLHDDSLAFDPAVSRGFFNHSVFTAD